MNEHMDALLLLLDEVVDGGYVHVNMYSNSGSFLSHNIHKIIFRLFYFRKRARVNTGTPKMEKFNFCKRLLKIVFLQAIPELHMPQSVHICLFCGWLG